MKVRKAVVPVAGFGTRFLPVTKAVPKVMLPLLDRPAIHFSVEEAARAGIEHVIFVISSGQESIGRYFDRHVELEQALDRQGKDALLKEVREIADLAEISYMYQKEQLGLGHAVMTARPAVGDEPFAVLLPDDIIWSDAPTIKSMTDVYSEHGGSVVAVKQVPQEAIPNLGIIAHNPLEDRVSEITGMVEKPRLEDAPSDLAIIGRYVLTPEIFDALTRVRPGAVGEIQLTDAIDMVRQSQGAYSYQFPGEHFDIGTPLGMLKASVYSALHRDDMSSQFKEWLRGEVLQGMNI